MEFEVAENVKTELFIYMLRDMFVNNAVFVTTILFTLTYDEVTIIDVFPYD